MRPGTERDDPAFIDPALKAERLDTYLVRRAVFDALGANRGAFRGVLLDVGCGQMPYRSFLVRTAPELSDYIGLDFSNNPIHDNQPDITWEDGRIPLDDDSVDCALCTEVLEHCPDPEAVLREVRRVLKPGGALFLTVPFLWPLHEVPYDEYRYTPFSLARHLSRCGFGQIDLRPLGGWDASLAQMLGLWVRRRKMSRWLRASLSYVLLPVIRLLARWDARAPLARYEESTMITGLSGLAVKMGSTGDEAASH